MVLLTRTPGQIETAALHGALLCVDKNCNGRLSLYVHEKQQSKIKPVIKAFEEMTGSMSTLRRCLHTLMRLVPQFQELHVDIDTDFIIVTWPCVNWEFLFDVVCQTNLLTVFIQVMNSVCCKEQQLIVNAVLENENLLLAVNVLEYVFLFESEALATNLLFDDKAFLQKLLKYVTDKVQLSNVEAGIILRLTFVLCRIFFLLAFADFGTNVYNFKASCVRIEVGSSTVQRECNMELDVADFERCIASLSKCDIETCKRLLTRPDFVSLFLCQSHNRSKQLLEDTAILHFASGLRKLLLHTTDITEIDEALSKSLLSAFPSNLRGNCRLPLYRKLMGSTALCCHLYEQFEASAEIQFVWSTAQRFLHQFDEQLPQITLEDEVTDAALIVLENLPGAADSSLWLCDHVSTTNQEEMVLQCVQSNGSVFMTRRHFMSIVNHLYRVSCQQQFSEVLLSIYCHLSLEDRNVILMELVNCPAYSVLLEHSSTLLSSLKSSLVVSFNKIMGLTEHADATSLFDDISTYSLLAPKRVVEHLVGELFNSALQAKLMAQICHQLPLLLCYTLTNRNSSYCCELLVDSLMKQNKSAKEISNCLEFLAQVIKVPGDNAVCWQPASQILFQCALPLIDSWTACSDSPLTPMLVGLDIARMCVEVTGFSADHISNAQCPRVVLLATLLAIVDATTALVRDLLTVSTLQSTALFAARDKAADIVTRLLMDFSYSSLQDIEIKWVLEVIGKLNWTTRLLLLDSQSFGLQSLSLPSVPKSCLEMDFDVSHLSASVTVEEVLSVMECCKVLDIERHPHLADLLTHYCTQRSIAVMSALTVTLPSCSSQQWRNVTMYLERASLSSLLSEVYSASTQPSSVHSQYGCESSVVVTTVLLTLNEMHSYSLSHWQHMIGNYCNIVRDQITKVSSVVNGDNREATLIMLLRDLITCMKMLPDCSKELLHVCLLEVLNVLGRKTDSDALVAN